MLEETKQAVLEAYGKHRNIHRLQKQLGHKSIKTTIQFLDRNGAL